MKVGMVTGSFPPQKCGIGDYTERYVRELRAAGVNVEVVTTRSPQRTSEPLIRYELDRWTVRGWQHAVDWMGTQSYDLIHIQYPAKYYGYRPNLAFLTATIRWRLPRLPIVVTIHEFRITHFLRKLTVAAIVSYADAVIVTADSERILYERWLPWTRRKLQLVHLATTIPTRPTTFEEKKVIRTRYGIRDEDVAFAYFGHLHPNKGIERLLRAFAVVHANRQSAKLLMMCSYAPQTEKYHASISHLVKELNLEDALFWTGYLSPEEVSRHLGSIEIGVFPFIEGVSFRRLSFMTAMCHGVPTVTTVGQVPAEELGLSDGENVSLVPADGSMQSLAVKLLALADSRALRERLREAAVRWSEPFQWNTVVKKTLDIYQSLTQLPHSGG